MAPQGGRKSPDICRFYRPDGEIAALTEALIASQPVSGDQFVCYRVAGTSPCADLGRHVERTVFSETFPGNDAAFMAREYGPYEQASTFFLSVDRTAKTVIGALRVIRHSPAGFKTLNDLAQPNSPIRLSTNEVQRYHLIDDWVGVWDVGTAAILGEYRRSGASASLLLYRGMYVTALQDGIDHLIAIIDRHPLAAMTDYLSIPFVPLCDTNPFSYLGSPDSQAVYGHIPEFDPIIKRRLSEIHDDPAAIRALNIIINGTNDQALLFTDDYK